MEAVELLLAVEVLVDLLDTEDNLLVTVLAMVERAKLAVPEEELLCFMEGAG